MMDAINGRMSEAEEDDGAGDGSDDLARTLDMEIDITFQKKRFTSLHLEEPTAKQMERAELELNTQNPTPYQMRRYQIALIANVAQVPREVVLELRNSQLTEAFGFLAGLLEPIPKTGAS